MNVESGEEVTDKLPDAMEEDEKICRYCFEDEDEGGPLISPCACCGGQKFVHLACLRRWQRMVLVSQPTHPAFYSDDARHHECNVCKAAFTCAPPTRHELMETFTGPELAALIEPACIIGSNEVFDAELEQQLAGMPPHYRAMSSYDHWIRGAYLITTVDADDGLVTFPVRELSVLQAMRHVLLTSAATASAGADAPPLTFELRGDTLTLVAIHNGTSTSTTSNNGALRRSLELQTTVPCQLVFKNCETAPSIGNDHVVAVNLTRPLAAPPREVVVEEARMAAAEKLRSTSSNHGSSPSSSPNRSSSRNGNKSSPSAKEARTNSNSCSPGNGSSSSSSPVSSPSSSHKVSGNHSDGGGGGGSVSLAALRAVEVTHYCGGPCDEDEIVCCLVPGGRGQGWTIVNAEKLLAKRPGASYDGASILAEALRLAASRAAKAAKTATSTGDSSNGKVTGGSSSSSGGKRAAAAAAEEEMAAAAAADEDDDDRGRGRGMKPQINGSSSSSSGARASGKSSGDNVSKEAAADDDDASAVPSGALLCSGASVRLVGLQARPDLNGHLAVCLAWSPSAGRWMVRLGDGSGKHVKPANLELADTLAALNATSSPPSSPGSSGGGGGGAAAVPLVPPPPRVAAFWGDARWSRTQLLGEISKGHWGLCKASVADVVTTPPQQRYNGLSGRLAFAPVTEMTEDFMRAGQLAMDSYRQTRLAQSENVHSDEEDDDDDELDDIRERRNAEAPA